ncbi:MAG: hypothetical protein KDM81_04890 [Verrucomicrobiae bacterium]|nr:hypothetical protein [Verrucomicrobiae bacterium]
MSLKTPFSWFVPVLLLVFPAGCSNHEEAPAMSPPDATGGAAAASRVAEGPNGEVTVAFDAAMQERVGLRVQPVLATNLPPEVDGFARVLDPGPLVALVADLAAADTTARASQRELERLQRLRSQENTSERALEAGQVAAARDKLMAESLRARLAIEWGTALAGYDKLTDLAAGLTTRQGALVRVDLPAGEVPPGRPTNAELRPLGADAAAIEAEFISAAPSTDPRLQGRGFLFLVRGEAPAAGAALTARMQTAAAPVSGCLIPVDAVVRHADRSWAYAQTGPDRFTRREATLGRAFGDNYFVTNGFTVGERLVVTGAQLLLSEELKGQGEEE